MARRSPVKEAYARGAMSFPDSASLTEYRNAHVSLDEAIAIVKSVATKSIKVPTEWFGLVQVSKDDFVKAMNDKHLRRNVARIEQEKGVTIIARMTIAPVKTYSEKPVSQYRVQFSSVGYDLDGSSYVLR